MRVPRICNRHYIALNYLKLGPGRNVLGARRWVHEVEGSSAVHL